MKSGKYQVLIPTGEITIRLIYNIRTEIEKYVKLPLSDEESFERVTNKKELFDLAEATGIPVPKTYSIERLNDLDKIADRC